MASAFTAPDRRKKVVTYGKLSRLPSIKAPPQDDDAPSPERPRKQATISPMLPKKVGGTVDAAKARVASHDAMDIFDVPSEDEFAAFTPAKAIKSLGERRALERPKKAPSSSSGATKSSRQTGVLGVLRPDEPAQSAVFLTARKPPASVQSSQAYEVAAVQASRRGKTPQPAPVVQKGSENERSTAHASAQVKTKTVVRAKTPVVSVPPTQQMRKEKTAVPAKNRATVVSTTSPRGLDIFDMPPSDDESNLPTPKPLRQVSTLARKESARPAKVSSGNQGNDQTGSDDSAGARKRKRRGSVSSKSSTRQSVTEKTEQAFPSRRTKSQKQEYPVSRGLEAVQLATATTTATQPAGLTINKPRRTRMRTVPLLTQPLAAKAQSSPAMLHHMVPKQAVSKRTCGAESAEGTIMEDDTMYEIPTSHATPLKSCTNDMSGSVTPRQKALFGSLLGSTATPSMPSISKLQLTDSKPKSLLAALSKSKSDLGHSTNSKKTRLIANMKGAESSSDESGSGSGSDNEGDRKGKVDSKALSRSGTVWQKKRSISAHNVEGSHSSYGSDAMETNDKTVAASQTSQTSVGYGNRSKLTYATSRSYLEEVNPEDGFLMCMDIDEPRAAALQSRDSATEDEEDASQARGKHELRRQGQNAVFEMDNMMLIDDMSVKSTTGIRRIALFELCAKMATTTFTHQLMESSLAPQFLRNLASNGDMIFDFAATAAGIFMLEAKPTFTVLDEIRHSELVSSMSGLLDNDMDIMKIAKSRKSNLSKLGIESVVGLRCQVMASSAWSQLSLETLSPQLAALKFLDMLVLGLREVGDQDAIMSAATLARVVDVAERVAGRCMAGKEDGNDGTVLRWVFSILEAVSLAKHKAFVWSSSMMKSLAWLMTCACQTRKAPTVTLAVKLCMNLTNNKPKACEHFSGPRFIQALVGCIVEGARLMQQGVGAEQRIEVLDPLILSLGAMINLTEHSDQARLSVDDGHGLLEMLVQTFVQGTGKSNQAVSMEESQSSVAIGYLSVLMGNLCLNQSVRTRVCAQLPGGELDMLVNKIKEFVQVHEHANRKAEEYEGDEGQETWQNYTARIMLVVKHLQSADG
ncbi:hypothetical protein ACEQ8H_000306 [Pleosporales sp. CAS-2024a]